MSVFSPMQIVENSVYGVIQSISALCSLYILVKVFVGRRQKSIPLWSKISHHTKLIRNSFTSVSEEPNVQYNEDTSVVSDQKNHDFVVNCLFMMAFWDLLWSASEISFIIWDVFKWFIPSFRFSRAREVNVASNYWIFERVSKSIGTCITVASYASTCWTVCFAIALYLSFRAGPKGIRFRPCWKVLFHSCASILPIAVGFVWLSFRYISIETHFFLKNPEGNAIFETVFHFYNAFASLFNFTVYIIVCILIWRQVSTKRRRIRHSTSVLNKQKRDKEWRLFARLSLFVLPFIIIGAVNVVADCYLGIINIDESKLDVPTLTIIIVYTKNFITSFKGILNALIFGFIVHRLDRKLAKCIHGPRRT